MTHLRRRVVNPVASSPIPSNRAIKVTPLADILLSYEREIKSITTERQVVPSNPQLIMYHLLMI
ncbi:hypothetical protein VCHA53O466_140172 [Vibrio chagasii]|nr:hypothetical protein VCHA53O466_140172 [Vibrio chagasii]